MLAELALAHVAMVSDALDRLGLRDQVLAPGLTPLGASRIAGRAFPIQVRSTGHVPEQPYTGEMSALESLTPGEVLVYGGDATAAALFGELFAHAAAARGAVGAVVDGFIRDCQQLQEVGFPVFYRGVSPLDTLGRAEVVDFGDQTVCAGVRVRRGDYVFADVDGIAIVPADVVGQVAEAIPAKRRDEQGARADIRAGAAIRDVWDRWQAF